MAAQYRKIYDIIPRTLIREMVSMGVVNSGTIRSMVDLFVDPFGPFQGPSIAQQVSPAV